MAPPPLIHAPNEAGTAANERLPLLPVPLNAVPPLRLPVTWGGHRQQRASPAFLGRPTPVHLSLNTHILCISRPTNTSMQPTRRTVPPHTHTRETHPLSSGLSFHCDATLLTWIVRREWLVCSRVFAGSHHSSLYQRGGGSAPVHLFESSLNCRSSH